MAANEWSVYVKLYDPSGNLLRNHEFLGSWGSIVARPKLKGIDGRAHKEWSLRLNSTQRGKTCQVRTKAGLTDR